jgi:hypothetical protein
MKHTKEHPGFGPVAAEISRNMGVPIERGRAILASKTRAASARAKRANPRLKRVKGKAKP